MILFFICAIIAFLIGYGFIKAHQNRLEKAVVYTATIIGFEEKMCKRGMMFYKAVRPSVKYDNGKREVIAEHHEFIRETDYHYSNGDTVQIRAYPELPKIFYFAEQDEHMSYEAIVCFVAAGFLLALGIFSEICFG